PARPCGPRAISASTVRSIVGQPGARCSRGPPPISWLMPRIPRCSTRAWAIPSRTHRMASTSQPTGARLGPNSQTGFLPPRSEGSVWRSRCLFQPRFTRVSRTISAVAELAGAFLEYLRRPKGARAGSGRRRQVDERWDELQQPQLQPLDPAVLPWRLPPPDRCKLHPWRNAGQRHAQVYGLERLGRDLGWRWRLHRDRLRDPDYDLCRDP